MSRSVSRSGSAVERYAVERVNYQWSLPDGTVCRAHTVILARRASELPKARTKFWEHNPHVGPVRGDGRKQDVVEYAYD